jgi:hypothetical protein
MKTCVFTFDDMRPSWDSAGGLKEIGVATLSAFAVEYAEFIPPRDLDAGYIELNDNRDFRIDGDRIIFLNPLTSPFLQMEGGLSSSRLVVHHYGVRDYALLFPKVSDPSMKTRLGEFYEEGEKVFESGSWLSFALMAGAVYEGLLASCLGVAGGSLSDLIAKAREKQIVDDSSVRILAAVRQARNLVHPSKHREARISRTQAMDIRKVLDRLIRALSKPIGN